jgi:hypothetical protein
MVLHNSTFNVRAYERISLMATTTDNDHLQPHSDTQPTKIECFCIGPEPGCVTIECTHCKKKKYLIPLSPKHHMGYGVSCDTDQQAE